MPDVPVDLAEAIAGGDPKAEFRTGVITEVNSFNSRVRTDQTGVAWLHRSQDASLQVGDKCWMVKQGAVFFVGGRYDSTTPLINRLGIYVDSYVGTIPWGLSGGSPYQPANISNGSSYDIRTYLPGGNIIWSARINFDAGFAGGQRVYLTGNGQPPKPRFIGNNFGAVTLRGVHMSQGGNSFNEGAYPMTILCFPGEQLWFLGDGNGQVYSGGISSGQTLSINVTYAYA